jgi:riboflavin kinase/FMN adenylyltransferase
MQVFRGLSSPALREGGPSAVTVGNFDGVHRGHQAMLALLNNEARHRGLKSTVLSFEPHPRDFFAARAGRAELAPSRIATLRDKLGELERCGIDRCIVLRFDERFASQSAEAFIHDVLARGLQARYVLVGDDFRFGARRAGDYAMLDAAGDAQGFDVARMNSYEVHGLRVSSSAVREALALGDMAMAASLLGRPYAVSGRVLHGRKLGRTLGASAAGDDGFRTLNLRFPHPKPAAQGIFAARVHGLADHPLDGVASLGVRPTVENGGRMLLEVHCLAWPEELGFEGGYGRCVKVELLHKLHDERLYPTIDALRVGIAQDVRDARAWFDAHSR